MKETVHVNISSQAFTLDADAYEILRNYLDDIGNRLPEGDTETMGDIESRISEIFREKLSSPMMVVTVQMVRMAMAQMGDPSDFGDHCRDGQISCDGAGEGRQLYRSRTNRSIAGICGGLAEFFKADVTVFRLVTLLLVFFGGLSIWVYIILWVVIPNQPRASIEGHVNYKIK